MKKFLALFLAMLLIIAGSSRTILAQEKLDGNELWNKVEKLEKEQKYSQALEIVLDILKEAREKKDNKEWIRALIRAVDLKEFLHNHEGSIRFLVEEKWPDDKQSQSLFHIFYGRALFNYLMEYYWEIRGRENVVFKEHIDIKELTASEIYEKINLQYCKALAEQEILGKLNVQYFEPYVQDENLEQYIFRYYVQYILRYYDMYSFRYYEEYVNRYRYRHLFYTQHTMFDFLVYQWVEFLKYTNLWTPEVTNEIHKLNLDILLKSPDTSQPFNPSLLLSNKAHPVEKIAVLLDYLYIWHKKHNRIELAFESQLEKLRWFDKIFKYEKDREKLMLAIEELLKGYENYPCWAVGQYEYAMLVKEKGDLVKAHALALSGAEKCPNTLGGKLCLYLYKLIEAPSLEIQAMSLDRLDAPSIQVCHKNITSLTFRAYKIDFEEWIKLITKHEEYDFERAYLNDLVHIICTTRANNEWKISIEDPGDYEIHTTYVTPEIKKNGLYLIAASMSPDFSTSNNIIPATFMIFSPLVILTGFHERERGYEVMVMEGKTGKAVSGVDAELYKYIPGQAPQILSRKSTDKYGKIFFSMTDDDLGGYYQRFLVVRSGDDFAFEGRPSLFYSPRLHEKRIDTFIYTDRSIYRPLQKLYFKVVAYQKDMKNIDYSVVPNQRLTVALYDPGDVKIEEQSVITNDFGTASGEFVIPKGRRLGNYTLSCNSRWESNVCFRVEEFKRPNFEVRMEKAEKEYRLNNQVQVKGKAIYYFGLPVTQGKVTYHVKRTLDLPWWYSRYYGVWTGYEDKIVYGNTTIDENGEFIINFTPEADNTLPSQEGVSYDFEIEATVTDEGGETREANALYNIGSVSIKANLALDRTFLRHGEEGKLEITRTDLNDVPRKGEGYFKIFSLKKSGKVMLPTDFPIPVKAGKKIIAGDKLKPRWKEMFPFDEITLKEILFTLSDNKLLSQGVLEHGNNGKASVSLSELDPGLYRIRYTTKDAWGSLYNTQQEFIVGGDSNIPFPLILLVQKNRLKVGEKASILVGSGIKGQPYYLEFYQSKKLLERRIFISDETPQVIDFPIKSEHRGGFSILAWALYDYKLYVETQNVHVPWENKQLSVEFSTFRDILRPGQKETWTVNVKGPNSEVEASEVLTYMYDRSLDFFSPHRYPPIRYFYRTRYGVPAIKASLKASYLFNVLSTNGRVFRSEDYFLPIHIEEEQMHEAPKDENDLPPLIVGDKKEGEESTQVRTKFQETAFFKPHLLTDKDGQVKIEFTVPDSVTSWNVYLHAMTKDLKFMTLKKETVTRKDLMVRPYLPRFLREGDEGLLKVVVNNATDKSLQGTVNIQVLDPQSGEDRTKDFSIQDTEKTWLAEGMKGANVTFALRAPHNIDEYAFKVTAKTQEFSDGELRPIPLLPGRVHLIQSKFVTLKDKDTRTLSIPDLANAGQDPTLVQQSLIVTLDGQLFYTVLKALPYLVNYPYECVEQIQNRFISTAILTSLYDQYSGVKKMAAEFSKRKTRIEPWGEDANRKTALEETPWLVQSREGDDLINVLDPEIAKEHKRDSLEKLQKAQIESGAFPWWPGGPPSPYMTLYILYGFAKAQEFKVEIPIEMVQRSWRYMGDHFRNYYAQRMIKENYGYEFITFLNYVLSCYNEEAYRDAFSSKEREEMLEYSFKHWRDHCPYLKAYLSLTLNRMNRKDDAKLVLESIMDSAKTEQDQGTFWAPEDRGWLWYNDHIESHAFILRTLIEVKPEDQKHIDGLEHRSAHLRFGSPS